MDTFEGTKTLDDYKVDSMVASKKKVERDVKKDPKTQFSPFQILGDIIDF